MRASRKLVAAVALPVIAMASSLSNWSPQLSNLDSSCQIAYNQQISGCSDSDFEEGALCSGSCVKGLKLLVTTVKKACAEEDFGDDTDLTNIIMSFQDGTGPARVCPNNVPQAAGVSSTSTIVVQTTTSSSTELSTAESSSTKTSIATPSQSKTSTTSSSGVTSTSATPTSTIQLGTTSTTSTSPSATSTSQSSQDDGSGGGSPFDAASDAVVSCASKVTMLLTGVLLAAGMC